MIGTIAAFLRHALRFLVRSLASVGGAVWGTVKRVLLWAENWLFDGKKATYGLAVTRMVFGFTACTLLLANFGTRLYTFGSGSAWNGELAEPLSSFTQIWLFSLFTNVADNDVLFTLLYLVLMVLAVLFMLGWRFRVVLPVFFVLWVSFIEMNDMVGDQGDNMFRIALILLFFADPAKRWSLDARRRAKRELFTEGSSQNQIGTVLHNLSLVALTAQVGFVYASGGLFKAAGDPWAHGWAVYDPLQTMRFGTWPVLSDWVTAWGPMVALATWGSVVMQVAFLFMLLSRPTRIIGLVAILSFHIAIGVLMGLPWFSLTMIAIDAIFISDRSWRRLQRGVVQRWQQTAGHAGESAARTPQSAA